MKIGLMSDTHDNLDAAEAAVEFFNSEGVEHVLHAGDLISPFTAVKFEDLDAEFHYVWGNNDGDRRHVRSSLESFGVEPADFQSVKIDGRRIALLHGTDQEIVDALAESPKYDAVVRGHTHEEEINEDPLVVNPGASSGYLSGRRTVAILETETMEVEIREI